MGCQVFVYKEGLYYWVIKQGTRSGFTIENEEEVDFFFPFGVFSFLAGY